MLYVSQTNINAVNATCEIIVFYVFIWTSLELQVIAGAERLCIIFKWYHEIEKVGNHCYRVFDAYTEPYAFSQVRGLVLV